MAAGTDRKKKEGHYEGVGGNPVQIKDQKKEGPPAKKKKRRNDHRPPQKELPDQDLPSKEE